MLSALLRRVREGVGDALGTPAPLPEPHGRWVMGVNLGGDPVSVQGHPWLGHDEAVAAGLQVPQARVARTDQRPVPAVEAGVRTVLNSVVFRPRTLELNLALAGGPYELYLWIMENYQSHWHSLQLRLQGEVVAEGLGDLEARAWRRYGPYRVRLGGEGLSLVLDTGKDDIDAHLMGISLYQPE